MAVLGSNWSAWVIAAGVARACRVDGGRDRAVYGVCRGDGADRPDTARVVVDALAGGRGHEGQPGRQHVGHRDVGGGVRPGVGQGDREGDDVADVGGRVADRLATARSACWGVSLTVALLLQVFGSNWSEWLIVAVFVRGSAETTVAGSPASPARRLTVPTCPQAGGRRCRCPGWASPTRRSARPAAGRSPARRWPRRARVGQRDREGDLVAHVGRRVAHRLGEGEVGLAWGASRCAGAVVAGSGSNWSASVIVAVFVRGVGETTVAVIVSVAMHEGDGADVPDAGGRRVGALAGRRRRRSGRREQVGDLHVGGGVRARCWSG